MAEGLRDVYPGACCNCRDPSSAAQVCRARASDSGRAREDASVPADPVATFTAIFESDRRPDPVRGERRIVLEEIPEDDHDSSDDVRDAQRLG